MPNPGERRAYYEVSPELAPVIYRLLAAHFQKPLNRLRDDVCPSIERLQRDYPDLEDEDKAQADLMLERAAHMMALIDSVDHEITILLEAVK